MLIVFLFSPVAGSCLRRLVVHVVVTWRWRRCLVGWALLSVHCVHKYVMWTVPTRVFKDKRIETKSCATYDATWP